jgi:hypothetical protein
MTARSTPYPPAGFRVRIPAAVWASALAEVRRYATIGFHHGRRGSEGLVYLAGVPTADSLIVTALFRLHHEPQGDCVMPTSAEVRWLLSTLRERDEKLIAQLHTHRHGARHSPGDDRMATSFHDGFLSIVAPDFATDVERIDQCIIHEYRNGTFRPLSTDETTTRFTVHEQLVDRPQHHAAQEPSRWRRCVQRLRLIARKQH